MSGPDKAAIQRKVMDTLAKYQGDNYVDGWAELWNSTEHLPWDKGAPHPALEDTLTQQRATIGGPLATDAQGKTYRKKALVPGCGRGVDVLLLASFGYDAYGLEYSDAAVKKCESEAAQNGDRYPVRDAEVGRGKITFVQGDFFKNDWLERLQLPLNCFDLIYDYTFLCALNPTMRPNWALRHTQLLAPSPRGNLICLEFPRHKDPAQQGPPWGLSSEAYMEHLSHPGEKIPYDAQGRCKMDPLREPSEHGLERVAYWQPARTHEGGKDENGVVQDRVSIWRHR
ncbi:putative thiol methyltransferase [Aspergillus homomorphus CBS 101889]|uniref:Thiol methyltransferase n=1 Tax=Aspergillus homomorphus (strain CBS 101889) TaxID=1450537 RepID=A0A395HKS1_ASPHC|nr:thiol methyltransferase [Aspergillus homomorphus CBS 101889]RAL08099.1 thiol methyltransferase [Aspergillus homomorphus CBS 101889]